MKDWEERGMERNESEGGNTVGEQNLPKIGEETLVTMYHLLSGGSKVEVVPLSVRRNEGLIA